MQSRSCIALSISLTWLFGFSVFASSNLAYSQSTDSVRLAAGLSTADWVLIFQSTILLAGLLVTAYFSYLTSRNSKRSLTAEALNEFGIDIGPRAKRLREIFGGRYGNDPIDIARLQDLMGDDDMSRVIKDYLNAYERLCRNVNTGIYDRKVVEISRRTDICNACKRFSPLIIQRRNSGSKSWSQFEKLARTWGIRI